MTLVVQWLVVAVIVACACGYAGWVLLPQSLRAHMARLAQAFATSRLRLPEAMRRRMHRIAAAQLAKPTGCGACSGAGNRVRVEPRATATAGSTR